MSKDHDSLLTLMADLRADREELVMLRKVYKNVLKALNARHPTELKKLEAVCDALPSRQDYATVRNRDRMIELSPPVVGY